MKSAERWSEHTRQLPPLVVGDHVRVGPHPKKWDKTGVVIEVLQFDQYRWIRQNNTSKPQIPEEVLVVNYK